MYKSSGLQVCRTTAVMQSGPNPLKESKPALSQTIIRVSYSFRLVLVWRAGCELPMSSRLDFSEKISANNFV